MPRSPVVRVLLWIRDRLADFSRLLWPSQEEKLSDPNMGAFFVVAFITFLIVLYHLLDGRM